MKKRCTEGEGGQTEAFKVVEERAGEKTPLGNYEAPQITELGKVKDITQSGGATFSVG